MKTLKIGIISAAALVLNPAAEGASNTITLSCNFPTYSDKTGIHTPKTEFSFKLVFEPNAKQAYMIGNNGSEMVAVIPTASGLSFLEVTDTGNVMTTTVASNGDAVHSRNGILLGELLPSQYYGKCERS